MPRALLMFLSSALLIFGVIPLARPVSAQSPETIVNSIGMKLVLIPKGTFRMGSPIAEEGREDKEAQHDVTISKNYYLGATEVTQGQYEKVMGTNPSNFPKRVTRKSDRSMYPVELVSWEDAVDFCKKLSELPRRKRQVACIVCLRRRSGNARVALAVKPRSNLERVQNHWANLLGLAGTAIPRRIQ